MFLRLRRKTTDKSLVLVNCGAYQFKISSFYLELAGAWDTLLSFIFAAQKPDLSLITRKCARHNYTDINYLVNMLDKTPSCNENVSRVRVAVVQCGRWGPDDLLTVRYIGQLGTHGRPPSQQVTRAGAGAGNVHLIIWKIILDGNSNFMSVCVCGVCSDSPACEDQLSVAELHRDSHR